MKRFIKFDDKNYYKVLLFALSIFFLILFIFTFSKTNISIKIINIVFVVVFMILSFNASKIGLTFNYKKNIIRAYVPSWHECCKLKMNEIKQIELVEIKKKRKKRFFGTFTKAEVSFGIYWEPNFVYRNGKIFNIVITMKDDTKHTIFYGMLYKAKSKTRVQKQEDKITSAIKEFIDYRVKNKFFKS